MYGSRCAVDMRRRGGHIAIHETERRARWWLGGEVGARLSFPFGFSRNTRAFALRHDEREHSKFLHRNGKRPDDDKRPKRKWIAVVVAAGGWQWQQTKLSFRSNADYAAWQTQNLWKFFDSFIRFVEKFFFSRRENSNLLMRKLFFSVLLIDELVDDELFNKVFIDFVAGQQIIRSILYRVSSPCPTFGN